MIDFTQSQQNAYIIEKDPSTCVAPLIEYQKSSPSKRNERSMDTSKITLCQILREPETLIRKIEV
jgi:hypothetical protein